MPKQPTLISTKNSLALASEKSANLLSSKQTSYIDMFIRHMCKNEKSPPDAVFADSQPHTFRLNASSGSDDCGYILNTDKPAMGFYGCFKSGKPHKWAIIPRTDWEISVAPEKEKAMKSQLKKALFFARTMIDDKEPEPDPVSILLVDAGRSNEIAIDSDAAVIELLAEMTAFEYDRVRTGVANRLNIRGSTLDKAVAKARKQRQQPDLPF